MLGLGLSYGGLNVAQDCALSQERNNLIMQ